MLAGAGGAITQHFFKPDAQFHFVDLPRALGVTAPITPDITPFHNQAQITRFAARDGIEISRWVALKLEGNMDDVTSIRAFGLDVTTRVCERLIAGGVPGLYCHTPNPSALPSALCRTPGQAPLVLRKGQAPDCGAVSSGSTYCFHSRLPGSPNAVSSG